MVLSGKRVQAERRAGEKALGLEGTGQGGKAGVDHAGPVDHCQDLVFYSG